MFSLTAADLGQRILKFADLPTEALIFLERNDEQFGPPSQLPRDRYRCFHGPQHSILPLPQSIRWKTIVSVQEFQADPQAKGQCSASSFVIRM